MNKEKLIIREMKEGEEREIVKTGRRAFPAFEALFVESPRMTMAAVYEDKIIGGIIYKFISPAEKNCIYIRSICGSGLSWFRCGDKII